MKRFIGEAEETARPPGEVKSPKPRHCWTGDGLDRKIRITFRPVRETGFVGVILGGKLGIAGADSHWKCSMKQPKTLKLMLKKF